MDPGRDEDDGPLREQLRGALAVHRDRAAQETSHLLTAFWAWRGLVQD